MPAAVAVRAQAIGSRLAEGVHEALHHVGVEPALDIGDRQGAQVLYGFSCIATAIGTPAMKARTLAEQSGVENVSFEVGDVLKLPFGDGAFDAAFSNSALMHIKDPVRAARNVFRVLRPGGVYGARDQMNCAVWGGATPPMERFFSIYRAWTEHRGTDLHMGIKLRPLLREAGFERLEASALFKEIHGTTNRTYRWAQTFIKMIRETTIIQYARDEASPTTVIR